MARIQKTIDVAVPVRTAYNQWTQFEEFPRFMEGVHEVIQMDDKRLHWRAEVGGQEQEWDAEIREQVPDQKVIWKNTSGSENAGMVTFDQLAPNQTRVHLEMSYDPEGFIETIGDKMGFMSRRVQGDLDRFKDFIEERGSETGGWRGEIHNQDAPGGHTQGNAEWGQGQSGHGTPGGSSSVAGTSTGFGSGDAGTAGMESGTQRATSPGSSMTDYPNPPSADRPDYTERQAEDR